MDGSQEVMIAQSDMVSTPTAPQALFSIEKDQITYRFYDAANKNVRAHFPAPQREVMVAEWNGSWGVAIPHSLAIGEKYQISEENPGAAMWVGPGEAAEEAIKRNVTAKSWGKQNQTFRPNYKYRRAIMTVEA